MSKCPARFSFITEYADPIASLIRTYQLVYHNEDNTIEMYDMNNKRTFLKRCSYPSLSLKELFVGATINIFSRALKIIDYGNNETRNYFAANARKVVLAISSEASDEIGKIVDALTVNELHISVIRMVDIAPDVAEANYITRRCILVVVNGVSPEDKIANISATFGRRKLSMISAANTQQLIDCSLRGGPTTAQLNNCAVCVIKPQAITAGHHGAILQRLIDEGFNITALGSYTLTAADAADFLEVYNGVVPEYRKLVEQMSCGSVWAIEVCTENAVNALRAVCGPHDSEICHVLFPHTIRAEYGVDRVNNAVHCTDLEEDGPLESEFFFTLIQNKCS